jgi:hypothetical protein
MIETIALILITIYVSWQYSKTDIDPDWAMFNLAGFTGSWYGRDFVDCKSPGVHIWYWLISKVVGADIAKVKFTNHFLVGIVSVVIYFMTGQFWAALAYLTLINSGWLMTFHGNVGQIPAALISIGMASGSKWLEGAMTFIATGYEPKLLFSFITIIVGYKLWYMIPIVIILSIIVFFVIPYDWYVWLIEGNLTIPKRMAKLRKDLKLYNNPMPWYTARGYLHILPWLLVGIYYKPNIMYWLPAFVYLILSHIGLAVRPNHLIILIPWVVFAGIPMEFVLGLVIIEWITSWFYIGDLWLRFYYGLADANKEAKRMGEFLRDKEGTMWVQDMHSGIYIYARKPIMYGLAEQIEIREVARERRDRMKLAWMNSPPDWVVAGGRVCMKFNGNGYKLFAKSMRYNLYQKESHD